MRFRRAISSQQSAVSGDEYIAWQMQYKLQRTHSISLVVALLFCLFVMAVPVHAQQSSIFTATLRAADSLVYSAPSLTAQTVTSVLNGNEFEVVGRSLDG